MAAEAADRRWSAARGAAGGLPRWADPEVSAWPEGRSRQHCMLFCSCTVRHKVCQQLPSLGGVWQGLHSKAILLAGQYAKIVAP